MLKAGLHFQISLFSGGDGLMVPKVSTAVCVQFFPSMFIDAENSGVADNVSDKMKSKSSPMHEILSDEGREKSNITRAVVTQQNIGSFENKV